MNSIKNVHVVAGILYRSEDQILLCQRVDCGKWEFPGGKIEAGESETEALHREIKEELGIGVTIARHITRYVHSYGKNLQVDLSFYRCHLDKSQEAKRNPAVHSQIVWVSPQAVSRQDILAGNLPVLDLIVEMAKKASFTRP